MRAASRLFAAVRAEKYLEASAPTGLTGLLTHPTPRSTLIYTYESTLDKLRHLPETSVYRQSTEALTSHRLKIIEAVKPDGYEAWQEKVKMQVAEDPDAFAISPTSRGLRVKPLAPREVDPREFASEWDGEAAGSQPEGIRSLKERAGAMKRFVQRAGAFHAEREVNPVQLAKEPPLTAEQISDLENQIGAGLIEEVIQVAQGEHKLVDEMVRSRVWEDLEEKAPEGQWSYFERAQHHTSTQKP